MLVLCHSSEQLRQRLQTPRSLTANTRLWAPQRWQSPMHVSAMCSPRGAGGATLSMTPAPASAIAHVIRAGSVRVLMMQGMAGDRGVQGGVGAGVEAGKEGEVGDVFLAQMQ